MRRGLALALFALLVPSAAAAEDYVPPDFLKNAPELPADVDPATVWKLDLAEALRIAVKNNLRVALERQTVKANDLGIDVASGSFEPVVTAGYVHNSSRTPPVTSQEGMLGDLFTARADTWQLNVSDRLHTGTILSAGVFTSRSASTLGTAVEPLNYQSNVSVGITQPLLRGFSLDRTIPQIDILRAKLGSERERKQMTITVADVAERTEDAYWDLVRALHNYDLALKSQKLAEAQLALSHRQIDAGLLPPSDITAVESTVAQRQVDVVRAEESIEAAEDILRQQLNLPRDQWSRPILPVDTAAFTPDATTAEDALAQAVKNRPEVAQADVDLKQAALTVKQADNAKLPQLDVGLNASVIGEDTDFGGAVHQVGTTDAHSWQVLVNFSWTPLRRATSAQAEITRVQQQGAQIAKEALIQQVWSDVRGAVRNERSAERTVYASGRARVLAEQTLEIEQRRFLNGQGQSSNFLIAQRQQEVSAAEIAELSAVLDHQKARAALLRATGRLLEARHIVLE